MFFASGLSLNIKVFRQFWLKVDHHWQRKHQRENQHTKPHSITEHSNWVKALLSVAETLLQSWHIHANLTGFARRLIVQGKQLGNGLKLCPSTSLSVVSHVEYSLSLARSVLFKVTQGRAWRGQQLRGQEQSKGWFTAGRTDFGSQEWVSGSLISFHFRAAWKWI